MRYAIPNELFNSIEIPSYGSAPTYITEYLKSTVYRFPDCSNLVIEKEIWNTVCDFCERTGALIEKKTGSLDANLKLSIGNLDHRDFLRFVGAGIGSAKTPVTSLSANSGANGMELTFTSGHTGDQAYALYSVIPDVNAPHDTTQGGTDGWKAPKWFFVKYDRAIIAGTLFRLHGMSGKAWSDFNAARSNALAYSREINRVTHGLITAGMRKQALSGPETAYIGNAQPSSVSTTTRRSE